MKTGFVVLVLAGAMVSCPGEEIVWDYDLTSAPDGWAFDPEWVFSPQGVRMDEYVGEPYQCAWGLIYTDEVVIPGGCDSIVLHVEQSLSLSGAEAGGASADISYRLNGVEWMELVHYSGWFQTAQPVHELILADAGQELDLRFEGIAVSGGEIHPGWGDIDWLLSDLTLTFYGEELTLTQSTWGLIKSSL